jgi:hypothetical protein
LSRTFAVIPVSSAQLVSVKCISVMKQAMSGMQTTVIRGVTGKANMSFWRVCRPTYHSGHLALKQFLGVLWSSFLGINLPDLLLTKLIV